MLLALLPWALPAQSPAVVPELVRLDAALTTETQLAPGAEGSGPERQVALAYRDVAEWQQSGHRPTVERALFRLADVTARRPSWPWPHYLAARTFLQMSVREAPLLESQGTRPGESYLEAAWRHLGVALRLNPEFREARLLLARIAYPSGDRELRESARNLLATEAARSDADPLAVIVWGRHQRTMRRYGNALESFDRAARLGGDRSVIGLERARALAALGQDTAAISAYWNGLRALTPLGRELYRQDLGWILLADTLASFDAAPDSAVESWARRFWGERDAANARRPGNRLLVHLKRWNYVHREYRVPMPWTRTMYTRVDIGFDAPPQCVGSVPDFYNRLPIKPPTLSHDPRDREPLLDHRALLFLKHGPPYEQITPAPSLDPTETPLDSAIVPDRFGAAQRERSLSRSGIWLYWIEGSWRVFSLRGSNALGFHAPTTLATLLKGGFGAWQALAGIDSSYGKVASDLARSAGRISLDTTGLGLPPSCEAAFQSAVRRMRADADVGIDTDSDPPRFTRPWRAVLRYFGVGSAVDGSGRVLVTFAFPISDLVAERGAQGGRQWALRLQVTAFRPIDGARIDLDTARIFTTSGPVSPAGLLTGWLELPLEAGAWQVATLASQPSDAAGGAWALRRNLVIDGGGELSISDIVLGSENGTGWRAPDGPFPVNTLGAWPAGGEAELWYEVRGLPEQAGYRTTIEVIPNDRRLGDPVRVATDDRSTGTVTTVRRTIGLDRLRPGKYKLVVTVEHEGTRAVREQDVIILAAPS